MREDGDRPATVVDDAELRDALGSAIAQRRRLEHDALAVERLADDAGLPVRKSSRLPSTCGQFTGRASRDGCQGRSLGPAVFPAGVPLVGLPRPGHLAGALQVQCLQGGQVALGVGGELRDLVEQGVEGDAGADGQGGLVDPLAGLGRHGPGSDEDAAVKVGQ